MGSSSTFLKVCLSMFLFALTANAHSRPGIFNVVDFGAVADGKIDNAKGTFLAGPVSFKGPCKAPIVFQIAGKVIAPEEIQSENWITFDYITGLTVSGGGTFDGRGALTWFKTECYKGGSCNNPINIKFNFVTDAAIRGITSLDRKFFKILVYGCKNMKFIAVKIIAPDWSHNTDGIHIGKSSGISISRAFIGHSISIGSLGRYDDEEPLSGIYVRNCTLTGTDNGVRIKTWAISTTGRSPPGLASNFKFEDILMNNGVKSYSILFGDCFFLFLQSPSRVKISNVSFKNIRGTSRSKLAVKLLCSRGFPCHQVELGDINLQYAGSDGPVTSMCWNVGAIFSGKVFPPTCV
ncbi:hypothetical protein GIB67_001439 [Kingdonia uniflora]|uniref:Polygalacturonase n=1 Tax=Kingdonia uniflora TaxID=39325 RepID=A0A7J7L6W7_9MAGN|nr:hypothetical protein GIB67_001439 [Kingdonia uniflora]